MQKQIELRNLYSGVSAFELSIDLFPVSLLIST